MKCTYLAVVVLGLGLASCNENDPPKQPAQTGFLKSLQQGQVSYSANMNNSPGAVAARPGLNMNGLTTTGQATAVRPSEPPVEIPANARWTLYCATLTGPDRFARINEMKSALIARSGMRDWYVIHNEADSTLFYGFYAAVEKSEPGAARAHADLKQILALKNDMHEPLFVRCFFTPITSPDPAAPAEWNLVNAPPKAYWSLEISAYKDNPMRKQAAVNQVKELRAKGVEAYYYHGASISSVCIGTWPADAVARQEDDKGRADNPDDSVLVVDSALPEKYTHLLNVKDKDGHRIRAYAQRIDIADPSLKAAMQDYPNHWVNYELYASKMRAADGSVQSVPSSSLLVHIPRNQEQSVAGTGPNMGTPSALNQIGVAPQDPLRQPGTSRLRSLDGN